jgi:integrase
VVTKTVSIKRIKDAGGKPWRVRWCEAGKDKSARHDTKEQAEAHAAELRDQKVSQRDEWQSLTVYERSNLIAAYAEAKKRGIDIHKAILMASTQHAGNTEKLSKAIEELKTSKLNNGASPDYVTNLGIVLNQFADGRESLDVDCVTLTDIESFLDGKSLQYRPTLRGKMSTLFNFCVRRGYRADNPCDRLETIKVVRPSPAVFTMEQVKAAVKWLKANAPAALPWFALSTFCGLRPEEAEKTTKADIHLKEGFIRVEAQTTKVRQRRVVYPRVEAVAFLKWALKLGSLPLSSGERRWILSGRPKKSPGLRGALGFKVWPKDITRHTAASYWLASEGETVKHVAKMLGHSESICESRYKALVTQKEAEEFWKVIKELAK